MVVFSGTSILLVVLTVLSSPHLQTINSVVGEIVTKQMANFLADPCEDFYEYSCGRFTTVFPNPSPKQTWTINDAVYNEALEKLKQALIHTSTASRAISKTQKYFRQCLNYKWEDQLPLINIINEFGYWPIYRYNRNTTAQQRFDEVWDINDFLMKASKYQAFPFLKIALSYQNTTFVTFERPEVIHTKYYMRFKKTVTETLLRVENAYRKTFGDENDPTCAEKTTRYLSEDEEETILDMFKLEKELTKLAKSKDENTSVTYLSTFKDVCEDSYDIVDFCGIVKSYFQNTLPLHATVQFVHFNYLNNFENVMKKYSNRTLASYIVWTVVHSLTTNIANTPYRTTEQINKDEEPNEKEKERLCAIETMQRFKFSTTRLYADEFLDERIEPMVKDLTENIKSEALRQKLEFFDDETWRRANLKLNKTRFLLLYPEFIFNETALDSYYQSYNDSGNYLSLNIQHALFRRNIHRWEYEQSPIDPQYLFEHPFQPSAMTHVINNWIRIVLAFVLEPIFYSHAPPEVLYGSFGRMIGHELLHLILAAGSKYDHNRLPSSWWSETSEVNYKDNDQCFKDFYSNMTMFGLPIRGDIAIDETSADSGGLYLAYKALERVVGKEELHQTTTFENLGLTKAQTFFLTLGQQMCSEFYLETSRHVFQESHPFQSIRLIGTLQNSKEFAEAFNCPCGSAYNPAYKCQLY